jgi:hypothetical protein
MQCCVLRLARDPLLRRTSGGENGYTTRHLSSTKQSPYAYLGGRGRGGGGGGGPARAAWALLGIRHAHGRRPGALVTIPGGGACHCLFCQLKKDLSAGYERLTRLRALKLYDTVRPHEWSLHSSIIRDPILRASRYSSLICAISVRSCRSGLSQVAPCATLHGVHAQRFRDPTHHRSAHF